MAETNTEEGNPRMESVDRVTKIWVEDNHCKMKPWLWLRNAYFQHGAYIADFFIRLGIALIISVVLVALGLGLVYKDGMPKPEDFSQLEFNWTTHPGSYLVPFNQSFTYNVLLDGHSHSKHSDGKMTVRQLLQWHIANGYNAVIVSDHNSIDGGLDAVKVAQQEYSDQIVVIPAMEYTCCRIHMNLIDINVTISAPAVPTDEELQAAIQQVHQLGGLVIVNHIPWSNTTQYPYEVPRLPNHPSVQDLIEWGVDGFEVVNGNILDYATLQIVQQNNLILMVGTDIHDPSAGGASTWLTVNAPSMTRQAIMDEIRARRTSFLYDPAGTRQLPYPRSSAAYDMLSPLIGLGTYFGMFYTEYKGMYSFHESFCQPRLFIFHGNVLGWYIFWLILALVAFDLTRFAVLSLSTLVLARIKKHRQRLPSVAD